MALGSYEAALGWLGSKNGKSSIRVFFDYNPLCTGKVDMLTHTGEKPYACTWNGCDYASQGKWHLKRHMRLKAHG